MPHAVLKTQWLPEDLFAGKFPATLKWSDYFLKFRKAFFDPKTHTALVETVVVEKNLTRNFYCMVTVQQPGEMRVRLDPIGKIERSPGIQLAVAYLAFLCLKWDPQAKVTASNLKRFFSFFQAPEQEWPKHYARLLALYRRRLKRLYHRQVGEAFVLSDWEFWLPGDWERVFGNQAAVEVEVGPGKGRFLFKEARRRPEVNFLGIEWAKRYLHELERKLGRDRPSNVRVAFADARRLFADWIPENSLQAVHVYFPDPWWKKRHTRRRLVTPSFIQNLGRCLWEGGLFYFATDVPDYFQVVADMMAGFENFKKIFEKRYAPDASDAPDRSNFEAKMRQQGRWIFEAHWQKWTPNVEVVSLVR